MSYLPPTHNMICQRRPGIVQAHRIDNVIVAAEWLQEHAPYSRPRADYGYSFLTFCRYEDTGFRVPAHLGQHLVVTDYGYVASYSQAEFNGLYEVNIREGASA